jgi:hypothetical protein
LHQPKLSQAKHDVQSNGEKIMYSTSRTASKRVQAIEALKTVLAHVSGVKLAKINVVSPMAEDTADIIAHVEIYGRNHTFACMVVPDAEPRVIRDSVMLFCDRAVRVADNATPVLIAQRFTAELMTLSRQIRAGLVDLQGNARIECGELFIACQNMNRVLAHQRPVREHAVKNFAQSGAAA